MRVLSASVLAVLVAAPLAAHGDDPSVLVHISPGREHHVASPVTVEIVVEGADSRRLANLRPGSFRVLWNDVDVTAAWVAEVSAQNGVSLRPAGAQLVMRAALPLPPGPHRIAAEYTFRLGGTKRFEQRFHVYDPARVRAELGPLANAAGAPRRGNRIDQTPPYAYLTPADKEFVRDARPTFRLDFGDTGRGVDPTNVRVLLNNADVTAAAQVGAGTITYRPPSPLANGLHAFTARVMDRSGNLTVETAAVLVHSGPRNPWMFAPTNQPHPLAHTHHQYQRYSSSLSSAYFHHGIDIRKPSGTRLRAVRPGKITAFYWYGRQPYYFEIEITDDDGYRWQYHHVDYPTIPPAIHQAAASGARVAQGADLGGIVYWPVSAYGALFHHVHLNLLAPDGRYVNPLNYLLEIDDRQPPVVERVFVLPNAASRALNDGINGATVSGKVDIVARAEDQVQNEPYELTVKKLTWEIRQLTGPGHHDMPETVFWDFNALPGGSNRSLYVHDIFKPSLSSPAGTFYTRGDYRFHEFMYTVTNRVGAGVDDANGYWDTAAKDTYGRPRWPNGTYRVTVRAYDIKDNVGSRSIDVTVSN